MKLHARRTGACRLKPLLAALLFFFFAAPLPYTQTAVRPTGDLLFKIAVYGPSDEIFIWWGHAALIVENTRWGYSRTFDWGIFEYPSNPNMRDEGDLPPDPPPGGADFGFLNDFLKNQVQYYCTSEYFNLDSYIEEDRDITIYTLDLDDEKKAAILDYAENNVLPENRYYDYHEFQDNCSTRIRDILDIGTGGQLKAWAETVPGRFSIRQHIRRYYWFRPLYDYAFDFLIGRDKDRPITAWEEMFLPVEVARHIQAFRYTDASGAERPLVRSIEIRNASKNRQPILAAPLTVWPYHLVLGMILAALLVSIKMLRKKHPRLGRALYGISQSIIGLFFGLSGCVLVFGLYFMQNDYIQQNLTLLFINPLLLLAFPLGILAAINRPRSSALPRAEKCLSILWAALFILGCITILARIIPGLNQQNQSAQALFLPAAGVLGRIPEACLPGIRRRVLPKLRT